MRILVACEFPEEALDQLRSLALDLVYMPGAAGPELREAMGNVSILVVGENRLSGDTVAAAKDLQLIVRAGAGRGDIAVEAASVEGVFVSHCPERQATAIAELAFGLMLALDRQIVENTLAIRAGRWSRNELARARGLDGRTLGLVGFGPPGKRIARRARAFDMHVLAWTPEMAAQADAPENVEVCNWPRELARRSDFVVLLPFGDKPEVVIDGEFLQCLADTAVLVHLGHAGAIDEAALLEAVERRGLRVAIDTHSSAPVGDTGRVRCRFCEMSGVIGTQNIGPLTAQARRETAAEVVRIIRTFIVTGEVLNALNLMDHSPATWQLVLRVRDQVGVMAGVLDAVRADGINAQEITSRVFTGAKAASCTIALDERPSTEALESIRGLPDVLHLELRAVV